ncbi:MAG: hypothetical protein ACRDRR_02330 [Pseudonocardiaceae bacterium]
MSAYPQGEPVAFVVGEKTELVWQGFEGVSGSAKDEAASGTLGREDLRTEKVQL